MVRMARFSSDDPGWVDPDETIEDRRFSDEAEWGHARVRPSRRTRERRRPNTPPEPGPRAMQDVDGPRHISPGRRRSC